MEDINKLNALLDDSNDEELELTEFLDEEEVIEEEPKPEPVKKTRTRSKKPKAAPISEAFAAFEEELDDEIEAVESRDSLSMNDIYLKLKLI